MNATLYPTVALFAWVVLLSSAKRDPALFKQPARLATWTLYLFFALIFTTGWAVIWSRLDAWTGLPESNTLVTMCLVVCYSANALALLQLWTYESGKARRRVTMTVSVAAVVLTAMVVLFIRSDTTHHQQQSFKDWYGGSVEYELYLLIYLTAFTAVEFEVIRLCRLYASKTTRSWLRTGLVTTAVGAAIGLLYVIVRVVDLVGAHVGIDISGLEDVAEAGAGLGALLVMIGLTLHWWGPRISTNVQRSRRLLAYVRLRPLWASFYALDPSIAFDDHRRAGSGRAISRMQAAGCVLTDPDYHVTRRVVEIRDGLLTLRPYQDPGFAQRANELYRGRGLVGLELDAAVTAAQIHAALDAREAAPQQDQPKSPEAGNAPADVDAELAWLLKVTRHFLAQPTILGALSAEPTPTGGIS